MPDSPDTRKLTPWQMKDQFPQLNEWWIGANKATLYNGARVPNVEEKIDLFGGVDRIRQELTHIPRDLRKEFLVLKGAHGTPLARFQLIDFVERANPGFLGLRSIYPLGTFYKDIDRLEANGFLTPVDGLTVIFRLTTDEGIIYNAHNRRGYISSSQAKERFLASHQ